MKKYFHINLSANVGSVLFSGYVGDAIVIPIDFIGGDNMPVELWFYTASLVDGTLALFDLEPGEAAPPTIRFSLRVTGQNAATAPLMTQATWTAGSVGGKYLGNLDLDTEAIATLLDSLSDPFTTVTGEVKVTNAIGGPISLQFPITLWKPIYTPPAS